MGKHPINILNVEDRRVKACALNALIIENGGFMLSMVGGFSVLGLLLSYSSIFASFYR